MTATAWVVLVAAVVMGARQALLLTILGALLARHGHVVIRWSWWLHLWVTVGLWLLLARLVLR